MAKGQDVLALAKAALSMNREQVIHVCKCIVANESETSSLRFNLDRVLASTAGSPVVSDILPRELKGLLLLEDPRLGLSDTVLPETVKSELDWALEDQVYSDALHDAGLSVPHKMLLSGPPGNGKTTLAGAIANALGRPLLVADFSAIVSSHMGETGSKIAKIFRGVAAQPCVLLIDEMETLLAERAGQQGTLEVGEAKRIVSTTLMELDRLPDHVLLVGATNHSEMLDRAVVRRFDFHWELPAPDEFMVDIWLQMFAKRHPMIPIRSEMPAIPADGRSLSDIEREAKKWCRRWVVNNCKGARHKAQEMEGAE